MFFWWFFYRNTNGNHPIDNQEATTHPIKINMEEQNDALKAVADAKNIVDVLFRERDNYQQSNKNQRAVINEIYQAYVGEMNDPKDRSKSQEKITKLRTETNYIVPSIFSGTPYLEVDLVGEEDKDLAFVSEEIVNYRLETIPQAYEKIEAWVKQSVVFGTSILNVFWRFIMKDNGDGTQTPEKDEPDFAVPNILDCFYNPIISNIENQKSLIFRSVLTVEEVKKNVSYNFTDATGRLNRDLVEGKGTMQRNQYDSTQQVTGDRIDLTKASQGTVEVYERVTCDRIQTVADGKERLVLRDVANPYYEITSVKLIHEPTAIPDRFDGDGTGHNTLGLGKLYQKMQNRSLDSVALTNNPFFIVEKGSIPDKRQAVVKVGGMMEVKSDGQPVSSKVQLVQFPDILTGAVQLMNKIEDEHKRASGANDLIQGAASNKTLGQDQIASTYSSNRFELINRRFKQALADVGRLILKMEIENIQSIDAPILKIFPLEAEVLPGGKIRYSRETVFQMLIAARERGDLKFNIKIKGDTNVARNKDMMLKQFGEWCDRFLPILPPANQLAAGKKWLELRGIDGVDELIPDMEDMKQPQIPGTPMQTSLNPGQPQL